MKYAHYTQPNGDSIIKNLLSIKERMGCAWSENMAYYAIRKSWSIPPLKWRECVNGLEYQRIQFSEV